MSDWQEFAACLYASPDLFFSYDKEEQAIARRICAGCDVRRDCYEYARTSREGKRELWGIWGGRDFEQLQREHRSEIQSRSRSGANA